MVSLESFIGLTLPASLCLWGQLSLLRESEPCARVIIGVILLVYFYTRHMQKNILTLLGKMHKQN